MPTYTLSYQEDGLGCARRIEFDAVDSSAALRVAQQTKPGRRALLSEGKRPLCRIERRALGPSSDIWVVEPVLAGSRLKPHRS